MIVAVAALLTIIGQHFQLNLTTNNALTMDTLATKLPVSSYPSTMFLSMLISTYAA